MTTEDAGQGRAVANVFMGVGGVAFIAAGLGVVSKAELRFIDATSLAGFGLLLLAAGLFQHRLVHVPARPLRFPPGNGGCDPVERGSPSGGAGKPTSRGSASHARLATAHDPLAREEQTLREALGAMSPR
jgi:hypothetical protein